MIKIKDYKIRGNKLHFTFCHQIPERSFFFKGKQFPLCSRCTGINLGYFILPFFILGLISIPLWWSVAMVFPTYIDGTIQAYTKYQSNNTLRFTSGIISGIGTMSLVSITGIAIGNFILTLIN
ncbi:DUF2085 domain-containing protein [Lacinutrix chionoecetis]